MTKADITQAVNEWTNWANQESCKRYDIALLKIWIQFEKYLAEMFINYATGGTSEEGFKPRLRLHFDNEEHLNAFLRNENRTYIEYPPRIKSLSKHIFTDDPFDVAIFSDAKNSQIYNNIIAIRNYVAHESGEAKRKYIACCCNNDQSRFKEPNEWLQEKKKGTGQTNYSIYIEAIKAMVDILVDPPT